MAQCVICFESSVLFPILRCCARTRAEGGSVKRICQPCRTKLIKGSSSPKFCPWSSWLWKGLGEPKCPLCKRNLVIHSKHIQLVVYDLCVQRWRLAIQEEFGGRHCTWIAPLADEDEWVTERGHVLMIGGSKGEKRKYDSVLGCELVEHPAWKKQKISDDSIP